MECMNDLEERKEEMLPRKVSGKKAGSHNCLRVRERNLGKTQPNGQVVKSGDEKFVPLDLQNSANIVF